MNGRLLAKHSATPDRPAQSETLPGHVRDVVDVARTLIQQRGRQTLDSLGVDASVWVDRLSAALLRAALVHDLGKANDQFQAMVRSERSLPQTLRHEVVGLWTILAFPELDGWLFGGQDLFVRYAVLRAVAGHHLQFDPQTSLQPRASGAVALTVLTGHPDYAAALATARELLGLPEPPYLANGSVPLVGGGLRGVLRLLLEADAWWEGADAATRRAAAAVAALLVGADVCGSALVRARRSPAEWASDSLHNVCTSPDLDAAAARRLQGAAPRDFQEQVAAASGPRTLVTAGCGTGKTVAAYLWAARHLADRKLFFCYPTTGTATEGFQDYAFPEFAEDAALVHSRAVLDIERIRDNGTEEGAVPRVLERYQGLALWDARVTVCTADTVLGLVQNNRVGLFGFPAIAGAGFVFDEVHLYDDRMFGSLLTFLAAFPGAPVLLMTATLPPGRLAALTRLGDQTGLAWAIVTGPPELETLPRYIIMESTAEAALDRAASAATSGLRVLWVANTVDRAIGVAQDLEAGGIRVEPYHSRYRYRDRLNRHRTVVDLFKTRTVGAGVVAVTTQVCEVSLDISADLLITELAPPPALVQRLGRLNRWATPESTRGPLPALVVEPPSALPYSSEELALGEAWLGHVAARSASQRDLHQAFATVLEGEPVSPPTHSAWLDDGWVIEPHALREPGATINVIRGEDLEHCRGRTGRPAPREVIAYSIPMLWPRVSREADRWQRLGFTLVAPEGRIAYDERWGARWSQQPPR